MRLASRHAGLIKFAAVAVVVFFAGSALTTHLVSKVLHDVSVESSEGEAEAEQDAEADEDEADGKAPAKSSTPKSPTLASKATYKQASADAIVNNNLFCPTCVPVEPSEQPVLASAGGLPGVGAGEVRSALPLQLLATMESDDPLWSMATIRDMDDNSLAPYTANEQVRPGVTILAVERGRVVLLNQGRREYIDMGSEPAKPAPTPAAKPAEEPKAKGGKSVAIEGAEQAINCSDENNCTVERQFVDKLLANPAQLITQARMFPVSKDGENAGFRVSGVRSGSLAKLIGLQNGDVVSEINGHKLGSLDEAMAMYQKLRRASHLSVTVERGGALIHKEIAIK